MATNASNGMPFDVRAIQCGCKYSTIKEILQRLELEGDDCAYVVGDPDNASYEYVIMRGPEVTEHSDAGYGIPNAALRDALISYYGKGA
ncbi:MAG: hypothetical protein RBS46_02370 [Methyloversatilis sp.]|jgi:hypothetical protein|nr:hypothetical protein [Methyloversatilis sp.]